MHKRPFKNAAIALAVTGLGLSLLTACGGANAAPDHAAPTVSAAPCPRVVTPLSQAEIDEALFMREEEKLARDVYDELAAYWLAQAGAVPVVTLPDNISDSGQQHMDGMKVVLDCYALFDPVDTAETPGVLIHPALARL